MEKRIFAVYGTLKAGWGNNRLLKDATFLGEHITEPKYTLYDGGFPVVERDGNTSVHCELYETTDEQVIERVFNLEGSSPIQHSPENWYDWDVTKTPHGEATIFVMNKGTSGRNNVVPSGKWK